MLHHVCIEEAGASPMCQPNIFRACGWDSDVPFELEYLTSDPMSGLCFPENGRNDVYLCRLLYLLRLSKGSPCVFQ